MKVIKVEQGKIVAISSSHTRPEDPSWKVVDESFPGKVGDDVTAFGDDLSAVRGGESVDPKVAQDLADQAEEEAEKVKAEYLKAVTVADQCRIVANQSIESANKASESFRESEVRRDVLEARWKDAAHIARIRIAEAERAIALRVQAEGDKAAEIARKAAIERAKKEVLTPSKKVSGDTGSGSGDAQKESK
jgi:hypothetical protein